jgi:hypothetical protein
MQAGCADPLANYSIVGHSFGGMIVNLVLRSGHPLTASLKRGITVGTPQYGYAGQLHRWFEGLPWLTAAEVEALEALGLNFLAEAVKFDMLEVIASMPALYTLSLLDVPTYSAAQALLGSDPNFPLGPYPSKDAVDFFASSRIVSSPAEATPAQATHTPAASAPSFQMLLAMSKSSIECREITRAGLTVMDRSAHSAGVGEIL